MKSKIHLFTLYLMLLISIVSCTPAKFVLDVPDSVSNHSEKISVSGVRGKGLPGSKRSIKFDRQFSGTLKNGWTISSDIYDKNSGGFFTKESLKRNLLLNFGLGINDVTSKQRDNYQFSVSDASSSVIVFCKQLYLGKSKEYNIQNKVDFSISEKQTSNFMASMLLFSEGNYSDWKLRLNYERETRNGVISTTLMEGMPEETGFITNKTDTIFISTIFAKALSGKNWEKSNAMPFPVVGGYAFKVKNVTIGMVDMYNYSVLFLNEPKFKTIITAAATALLLRNR